MVDDEHVDVQVHTRALAGHLSGLPVRDYRGEIELEPTDQGTRIGWHISFTPMVFGTGSLLRWAIGRFAHRCADGLAGYPQTIAARER